MLNGLTDSRLSDTILPLVLSMAGDEGTEPVDKVGDLSPSCCCCWSGGSVSFSTTAGFSMPLMDFLRACLALCIILLAPEPGEPAKRLAREATFPSRFFLLLGPSSSEKAE